jgi:hypothetical protein
MTNDLELLREAWGQPDPPAPAARSAARTALLERARAGTNAQTPARLHRFRRPRVAAGAGLAVGAVAATAVMIASGTTVPAAPRSHPHVAAQLSGQQILLAAATTAATEHTGTYWHFKITMGPPTPNVMNFFEDWFAHDGRYWSSQPACVAPPGTVVFEGPGLGGFAVQGGELTYSRTRHLPTDPAALIAWIATHGAADNSSVAGTLIALQYEVPAPPEVRAAAFRALATFPDVKNLGPVDGGVSLLISFPHDRLAGSWIKVVIDPRTALVRSETTVKGTTLVEISELTDRLPRVIPLPPKNACGL